MADLATRAGTWKEKAQRLAATTKNLREKAKRPVEIGIRSITVQAAAFGTSYYKGRQGDPEVFGMPADLLVAAGLHVGGFVMGKDATADVLHNLGDGVLASYVCQVGYGTGLELAAKANNTTVQEIINRRATGRLDNGQPDPEAQNNNRLP